MRVLFCGTASGGDTFDLNRANASVLVEQGATAVLFDCGAGSLSRLIADGKSITDVTAVAISHLHHDHVLGLAELFGRLVALNAGSPPPVYGPRGTTDFMDRVRELARPLARFDDSAIASIQGHEVAAGASVEVGEMTLTAFEVQHAPNLQAFGWRVTAGASSVVYSGDTAASKEIMVPQATGCDLLIHDAFSPTMLERRLLNRPDSQRERLRKLFPAIHGEAREVGAVAAAAGVKRLVLTSIGPHEDLELLVSEVRAQYAGPLDVAEDGQVISV